MWLSAKSAMAKAIGSHSVLKSGLAMAIMAIHVVPPMDRIHNIFFNEMLSLSSSKNAVWTF